MDKKDYRFVLRWAKKLRAVDFLGGKCQECDITDPTLLEFHHPNRDRELRVSRILEYRWSIALKEIRKCVLLCKNCHIEEHIVDKRGRRIKENLLRLKGVDRCECGYGGLALEFHHREDKKFNLGDVVGRKLYPTLEVILSELAECDVSCRNCHTKEHFDYEKFNKFLPLIRKRAIEHKECPKKVDRDKVLRLLAEGHSKASIARMMGCVKSTITLITKGV